jgi:hypothetical protein
VISTDANEKQEGLDLRVVEDEDLHNYQTGFVRHIYGNPANLPAPLVLIREAAPHLLMVAFSNVELQSPEEERWECNLVQDER